MYHKIHINKIKNLKVYNFGSKATVFTHELFFIVWFLKPKKAERTHLNPNKQDFCGRVKLHTSTIYVINSLR